MKPIETDDFDRLVTKFRMKKRERKRKKRDDHVRVDFFYQGRKICTTRRSHGKKGNPSNKIAEQLSLSQPQLWEAVRCTLSLEDYIAILRDKGLLSD